MIFLDNWKRAKDNTTGNQNVEPEKALEIIQFSLLVLNLKFTEVKILSQITLYDGK